MKLAPPREVGSWMRAHMEAQGLTANQVAKRIGLASNGMVSQVIRGERPVPLARLHDWTLALSLEGAPAAEFQLLAYLGHCPRRIVDLYWQLSDQADALRAR